MASIKISVVTVVYNGSKTIEDTIKSVLNCKYKEIEHIIIDGASNDGTVDIIKQYSDKIAYWVSERDNGIYDAMNKGWSKIEADRFVLFLGSGDRIITLPEIEDDLHTDVIFGNVMIGDNMFHSKAGFVLKLGNSIHHQALLVRKSVHVAKPFNLTYKIYADFDFNQRLLKAGVRFTKNDSFCGFALEGGVSSIRDAKEMLRIVQKNYGLVFTLLAKGYYFLQSLKSQFK